MWLVAGLLCLGGGGGRGEWGGGGGEGTEFYKGYLMSITDNNGYRTLHGV